MSDERSGEGPPPPSPLTGAYLLVVLPQLHSPNHKDRLIHALTKGLITWDAEDCHVDLDKELQNITAQSPEGEEAKNGERLIQFASENLVTEVLIHPQLNTLVQCMRNCLSSFTRHRHIVHAGYTSTGNGAWVLQDGTYSFSDFADMYSEHEVQRVLRAYEGTVSVDVHCSGEGDWWALKAKDPFSKVSRVRLNPPDKASASSSVRDFLSYLGKYLVPAALQEILESSDVVGNIRFSHPTLYVFPGGQGDAALFGINGFNMLVDGGFSRKACFWDFTRHLDRLDSVLMTRINNGNLQGLASLFRRKKSDQVYPQIGHFFSNIPSTKRMDQQSFISKDHKFDVEDSSALWSGDDQTVLMVLDTKECTCVLSKKTLAPNAINNDSGDMSASQTSEVQGVDSGRRQPLQDRRQILSPDGDKDRDPLQINLIEEGQEMLSGLRHLGLKPQACYREPSVEPINLYHKVGHGKLDMYVLSPAKDSREVREFLAKWAAVDSKIFCSYSRKGEFNFPLSSKASICALLVWQPANPEDNITRILFPGSTPQQKIFEGLDRLKNLEFMKHPVCSAKSLSPSSSTVKLSIKGAPQPPLKSTLIEKVAESEKKQTETVKAVKQVGEVKKSTLPPKPKPKVDRPKEKPKTDLDTKQETVKIDKKTTEAVQKGEKEIKKEKTKKTVQKQSEKKIQKPTEKKSDSVKSSPTTPKKTVDSNVTETSKTETKPRASRARASPSATPAKSAKEANNRKVVELKSKETTKLQAQKSQPPKKEEPKKVERPVTKKPTVSPKGVKSLSPVKAARPGTREKLDVKKHGKPEKEITTDSSAVSTPSTVDAELTKAKEDGKAKDVDKKEEPEISRKESEDRGKSISKEEDEEILIIEKVEISNELTGKSDVETIELHLQKADEKKKTVIGIEETKTSSPENGKEEKDDNELIPEPQQVAQEEVQEIIETATEIVTKKLDMQKTESQEISGKEMVSTDKISTPKEKEIKSVDVDQKIDESQPDEKFSTTVESGATTTAPTLPEDERIPLDEIKEGVEEKHVKEETKEKEVIMAPRPEQLTSLPQVPVIAGTVFDQRAQLLKDIVKTPDEVADLPVHEEVDVGFYEGERKDELLSLPAGKKDKKEDTTEELKLFKDNLEKEDKSKDLKEDMVESVDVLSHTTTDLDLISSSPKSGKPLESEEKEEEDIKDEGVFQDKPEEETEEKPEALVEDGEKKDIPEKKSPEIKKTQEEINVEISKDSEEKEKIETEKDLMTTTKPEEVDEIATEKQDDEELKEGITKQQIDAISSMTHLETSDEKIKEDDIEPTISKPDLEPQVGTSKEESEKEKISIDEKDVVEESSDTKSTIEKTEDHVILDIEKQQKDEPQSNYKTEEITSAEVVSEVTKEKSPSPKEDDKADNEASPKEKSREVTPEPAAAKDESKLVYKETLREASPELTEEKEETMKLSPIEKSREITPEPAETTGESTILSPKEKSRELTPEPAETKEEAVKLSRETSPEPAETKDEVTKLSPKDKSREVTPEPAETKDEATKPSPKDKSREVTPEPAETKEEAVKLSREITPEPAETKDEGTKPSPKDKSREITPEPAETKEEAVKLSREITPEPAETKDETAKLPLKDKSHEVTPEPAETKEEAVKLSTEITPELAETKDEATKPSPKDKSREVTPEPAETKEEAVKLSREITPEPAETKDEGTKPSPKDKSREITPEPDEKKEEAVKLSREISPEPAETKDEDTKLSPKDKSHETTPEPAETKEEAEKLSRESTPEPAETKDKATKLSPKDKSREITPEPTETKGEVTKLSPKEISREDTPEPADAKEEAVKLSRVITPEPTGAVEEVTKLSPKDQSREITPEPTETKDELTKLSPKEITPESAVSHEETMIVSPKEKSREITPEPSEAVGEATKLSSKEISRELTPKPTNLKEADINLTAQAKSRESTPEPTEEKEESKELSPKETLQLIMPETADTRKETVLLSTKEKSREIIPEPADTQEEAKHSEGKSREVTPEPADAKEEKAKLSSKEKSREITPEAIDSKEEDDVKLLSSKDKTKEILPEKIEINEESKPLSPKEKSREITHEPTEVKEEAVKQTTKESQEIVPVSTDSKHAIKPKDIDLEDADDVSYVEKQDLEEGELKEAKYINGFVKEELEAEEEAEMADYSLKTIDEIKIPDAGKLEITVDKTSKDGKVSKSLIDDQKDICEQVAKPDTAIKSALEDISTDTRTDEVKLKEDIKSEQEDSIKLELEETAVIDETKVEQVAKEIKEDQTVISVAEKLETRVESSESIKEKSKAALTEEPVELETKEICTESSVQKSEVVKDDDKLLQFKEPTVQEEKKDGIGSKPGDEIVTLNGFHKDDLGEILVTQKDIKDIKNVTVDSKPDDVEELISVSHDLGVLEDSKSPESSAGDQKGIKEVSSDHSDKQSPTKAKKHDIKDSEETHIIELQEIITSIKDEKAAIIDEVKKESEIIVAIAKSKIDKSETIDVLKTEVDKAEKDIIVSEIEDISKEKGDESGEKDSGIYLEKESDSKEIVKEEIIQSVSLSKESVDLKQELAAATVDLKQELEAASVDLKQELEVATVDLKQELEVATVDLKQELESATVDLKEDLEAATVDLKQEFEAATVDLKQELEAATIGEIVADKMLTKQKEESSTGDIISTGEKMSDFESEMREVERQFEKLDKEKDLRSSSQEAEKLLLGDKDAPVDLKLTKKEDVKHEITDKIPEDESQRIGKLDSIEKKERLKDKDIVETSKDVTDSEITSEIKHDAGDTFVERQQVEEETIVINGETLLDEVSIKDRVENELDKEVRISQEEGLEKALKLEEKVTSKKVEDLKESKIEASAGVIGEIKDGKEVDISGKIDIKTESKIELDLEGRKDKSDVPENQPDAINMDLKAPEPADAIKQVESAKTVTVETEIKDYLEPALIKGKEVSEFSILDDLDTDYQDEIDEGSELKKEIKEFINADTGISSKTKDDSEGKIVEQKEKPHDIQQTIKEEVDSDSKDKLESEKSKSEVVTSEIHEKITVESKEEKQIHLDVEKNKETDSKPLEDSKIVAHEDKKDSDDQIKKDEKPKDEKICIVSEEKGKVEKNDTDTKSEDIKEKVTFLKEKDEKQDSDLKIQEEKEPSKEKVEEEDIESNQSTEKTEEKKVGISSILKEEEKETEEKIIDEKKDTGETIKEIKASEKTDMPGKTEEKQVEKISADGNIIDKVKPEEKILESKILQEEAELKKTDVKIEQEKPAGELKDKVEEKDAKADKVSEPVKTIDINDDHKDSKDIEQRVIEDSEVDQEDKDKSETSKICEKNGLLEDSKVPPKLLSSETEVDKFPVQKTEETDKNEGKSEQKKDEEEIKIKYASKESKTVSDIEEKLDASINDITKDKSAGFSLSEEKVEEPKTSLKQEQPVDSLSEESFPELKDSAKTEAEKKVEETTEGSLTVSDSPEKVEKGSIDSSIKEEKTDKGDISISNITSIEKEIISVISSQTEEKEITSVISSKTEEKEIVEITQSTSRKVLDTQPESLTTSVLSSLNGFADKHTDDFSGKKESETKLEETTALPSTFEMSISQETLFSSAKGEKDNVNEDLKSKMKDDKQTHSTEDTSIKTADACKDSEPSSSQEISIEKKVLEIKDEVKELSSSIEKTLSEVKDEVKEISSSIQKGIIGVKEGVKEVPSGIEKGVLGIKEDITTKSAGIEKEIISEKEEIKEITSTIEKELVGKEDIKQITSTITNGKKEECISDKLSEIVSGKSLAESSLYTELSHVSNGKVEKDLPNISGSAKSKSSVDEDGSITTVTTVTTKEIISEVKPSADKSNGFQKSEEYIEKTETTCITEISKPDQKELVTQSAKDISETSVSDSAICIVEKITTEKQEIDGVKDVSVIKSTLELSPPINGSSTQDSSKKSEVKDVSTSSEKKDSIGDKQSSETIKTDEIKMSSDLEKHTTEGGSTITKTVTTTKETVSSSASPKLSERKSETLNQGTALTDLSMIKDMTASFISTEKWTGRTIDTPEGRISPSSEASAVWRESDDDLPASPLSTTSHLHSPPPAMFSSVYGQRFEDDDSDVDFETAVREHAEVRGQSFAPKDPACLPPLDSKDPPFQMPLTPRPPLTGQPSDSKQLPFTSQPFEQKLPTTSQIPDPKQPIAGQPLDPLKPPLGLSLPPKTQSDGQKPVSSKDPIEKWDKPLGLPPPPNGKDYWSPFKEWGRPLHLPSPAPPPPENDTEDTSGSAKTTPKKVAKMNEENNRYASSIMMGKEANNKNRRSDSPVKKSVRDGKKSGMSHIYLDLSYVPHHGNSHYANVEFFKRVRARYYVFSGTEPSKDVFNALLEAKQTWEDKDLEVTIIPTYDTDTLGYWIAENEETLSKYKIDLSPSASRCTINLQDHDTSCSAYRLEF